MVVVSSIPDMVEEKGKEEKKSIKRDKKYLNQLEGALCGCDL